MRTSGQLKKTDICEFNPNANVRAESNIVRNARIQKQIAKRALMGEPIEDFRVELANAFDDAGAIWENEVQRENTLNLYASRIDRFVNWELSATGRENKLFRGEYNGGEPIVVDYFGEEVEAVPDYIVDADNALYVCKVKTGRYQSNARDNCLSQEGYCLGLAGEKLKGDSEKPVIVQYLYLGDSQAKNEMMSLSKGPDGDYMVPYDSSDTGYEHISEEIFDDRFKESVKEDHEQMVNDHTGCSPEECASCAHNNICHFEEPPIPAPPSETVRDINVTPSYEQGRVIDFEEGKARVNAGPGAGKTFVVGCRIASLVEKGYDSNRICVLTFTNAGAGEMTERAMRIAAKKGVPLDPDHITSCTINAFCQKIIEDNYERLGYTKRPTVVKPEVKRAIINKILDQFPRMSKWTYPSTEHQSKWVRRATSTIAYIRCEEEFAEIKRESYTRDSYPDSWNQTYTPAELDILFLMYEEFQRQMLLRNKLEFDDQLRLVNKLYEENTNLFNELGYEHIIVDEFQDTDLPQIHLLQKMCDTTSFKSLMCVGDDSQSVFGFRHTSPEFMVNFATYFGNFEDYSLLENHRSNKLTIDMANKVIGKIDIKVEKELVPLKEDGIKPVAQGFYSQKTEYDWVARQVASRWNAGNHDIAVIMSDSIQLNAFADALSKYGIPSTVKSPVPVMSNSRVKALVTFYDAFLGKSTQGLLDYQNAATHGGLKGKTAAELEAIAEEFSGDLKECKRDLKTFVAFAEALDSEGTDECYQDFLEGFRHADNMDEMCEFMEDFKLYGSQSKFKREGKYDGVCLTTIHSSKGLEWDTTFLCVDKLDDVAYHNHHTKYRANGEYDEQLRKMFVGCTRAKEELIVTGQYVLAMDEKKNIKMDNDFLHYAYEFCDKAWDYEYTEYRKVKDAERAEGAAVKGILQRDGLPTMGSGKVADVIAKHTAKKETVRVKIKEDDKPAPKAAAKRRTSRAANVEEPKEVEGVEIS